MNYGISPDQAGKIVDRLANAGNNPITAPSEAAMPSNDQFFRMSQVSAPVDFMSDPRYQPIQSGQTYAPTIAQPQVQGDKFSQLGVIGDFFRLIEQGGGIRPNGQLNNPNNVTK